MIHFDFIVDDAEAEAIFGALQDEIVKCMAAKIETNLPSYDAWYDSRIKFLKELKGKMTNSKVQE